MYIGWSRKEGVRRGKGKAGRSNENKKKKAGQWAKKTGEREGEREGEGFMRGWVEGFKKIKRESRRDIDRAPHALPLSFRGHHCVSCHLTYNLQNNWSFLI